MRTKIWLQNAFGFCDWMQVDGEYSKLMIQMKTNPILAKTNCDLRYFEHTTNDDFMAHLLPINKTAHDYVKCLHAVHNLVGNFICFPFSICIELNAVAFFMRSNWFCCIFQQKGRSTAKLYGWIQLDSLNEGKKQEKWKIQKVRWIDIWSLYKSELRIV